MEDLIGDIRSEPDSFKCLMQSIQTAAPSIDKIRRWFTIHFPSRPPDAVLTGANFDDQLLSLLLWAQSNDGGRFLLQTLADNPPGENQALPEAIVRLTGERVKAKPAVEKAAANALKAGLAETEPILAEPGAPPLVRDHRRLALVIGISRYAPRAAAEHERQPEPFTNLMFAAKDAVELHRFLSGPGGYVVEPLLLDEKATLSGILRALDELRKKCSAVPDSTVLIYFSGHAERDADGRSYLVPHDAWRNDLFATALWSRFLSAALDDLNATRLAVILDACHAEAIGNDGAKGAEIARFDPQSLAGAANECRRFVVASCAAGQKSYEDEKIGHGIFTWHLLELLSCKDPKALPVDDSDDSEDIDLWDLYCVLKTRVKEAAKSKNNVQEPFASFKGRTGCVLATNEQLRLERQQLKLYYLQILCDFIGKTHKRPEAITRMLRRYCAQGTKDRGFDALYRCFDEGWKNTDPKNTDAMESESRNVGDAYDEALQATRSTSPPNRMARSRGPAPIQASPVKSPQLVSPRSVSPRSVSPREVAGMDIVDQLAGHNGEEIG